MTDSKFSRRAYLGAIGTIGTAAVAGCASDSDGSGSESEPEPSETATPTSTGDATPTATATGTETRTPTSTAHSGDGTRGPWPSYRGGPRNRGYAPSQRGPSGPDTMRWTQTVDGFAAMQPAAGDDAVFVPASNGLHAFAPSDGTRRWHVRVRPERSSAPSTPAVAGGAVVVGHDGTYVAVEAATGDERWRFDAGSITVPPTVAEGAVVGAQGKTVYAIDLASGDELWSFDAGGSVTESASQQPVAIADGLVFVSAGTVGGDAMAVHALDLASGRERWRYTGFGAQPFDPSVGDGLVYAGTHDGHLYAFDAGSGDVQWSKSNHHGAIASPPLVADGRVYPISEGRVHARDAATGASLWTLGVRGRGGGVAGDTLYLNTTERLYAVDAATGEQLWSKALPGLWGNISQGPAFGQDTLYIGGTLYGNSEGDGGVVYALGDG